MKRTNLWIRSIIAATVLLFTVTGVRAQTGTTSLRGTVMDKTGAAIAGAKVTVSNTAQAVKREVVTSETGSYAFQALPPGNYALVIEIANFRRYENKGLELLVDVPSTVNATLEIGAATETVEISGQVEAVNTTDASIGNAFNSRQILALPFEGRDAAGVLSLQPGVTFIGNNVDTGVDTRNGAVNGGRSDQANITLDGVDNNTQLTGDAFVGAVRSTLDSIEEFRVTTAGVNSDQGRSSGGQVTLVTKSGTNTFHGSAYEQNRSRIGEANDWFNKHTQLNNGEKNVPGELVRNVFGGSLGGPIKKDRLFFFLNYEGLRRNESAQVSRNVPGTELRDGVVNYPCAATLDANGNVIQTAAQVCPGTSMVTGVSGTKYAIAPGTFAVGPAEIKQMDPNCTGLGTCPMGNGVNTAVLAVLQQYQQPNSSACVNQDGFNISCISFSAPNPVRQNTSIAKVDYNLNQSGTHRLFLRGNYQSDSNSQVPQFPGGPAIRVTRDTSRALAAGYLAVFSNSLVNNFRYGFTRQSRSAQGLQTQQLTSLRFLDDLRPATSTNNFHVPVHNWVDDLTWTRGKHTLQFGTNLRLINNVRTSNATSFNGALVNPLYLNTTPAGSGGSLDPGAFGFPAVDPGNASVYNNAIIDLVGIVDQVTGNYNRTKTGAVLPQGAPVARHFRSWEYDWYVQDVWHVTSSLTITGGLRYTILEPPYETTGTQAAPNLSLGDFVSQRARLQALGQVASPTFSFDLAGQANGKKPYWPYDYKDFGPRIAIAYSPRVTSGLLGAIFGGPGKSSIRAGFGIVYDHFGQGIVNTFDQNGTFGLTTSITNAASIQTVDGGARFTGLHDIPVSSNDGVLLTPAPSGGFPATPPTSVLNNPVQQISWGLDDKIKTPYSELVDFSVTRELPGGFVIEAAYVGRFAHRLLQQRDLAMPLNIKDPKSGMDYFTAATILSKDFYAQTPVQNVRPIPFFENLFPAAAGTNASLCGDGSTGNGGAPGNGALANPTATQSLYELYYCNTGGGTFGETNAINIFDSFCFPACLNQQPGQAPAPSGQPGGPFQFYSPQFTALYAWSSTGSSSYHAGEFTLRSRPTHGLQFDLNYTLSKSLDVCSDAERVGTFGGLCAIINTWAPNQLRGPSDFDARHAINSNLVYDLPFGRGRKFGSQWTHLENTLLGGWEIAGVGRWSSGLPFSVGDGFTFPTNFQLTGNAVNNGPAPATGLAFLTATGDPYAFKQGGGGSAISNFRFAFPGESGQRNNFRGQGYFGIDAGVNKTFQITERHAIRLSAYAFNLTNSVRFDAQSVSANLTTPATFGLYSNTLTNSRRMEFAVRYSF
ncbi:MAG: hypothetical protein PVS2B2_06720 [Candidatus Acidiferrum sp.]